MFVISHGIKIKKRNQIGLKITVNVNEIKDVWFVVLSFLLMKGVAHLCYHSNLMMVDVFLH